MLRDLANSFYNQCESTEQLLQGAIDAVRNHCTPSQEIVTQITDALGALQDTYTKVREYSASQLSADEMPAIDAPVEAYYQAVISGKRNQLVKILNEFLSVTTNNDKYTEELAEAQTEARKLLVDKEPDIEPYKAFIDGIRLGDAINDDEGDDIIDKVQDFFSRSLARGLTKQVFVLPETSDVVNDNNHETVEDDTGVPVDANTDIAEENVDIDEVIDAIGEVNLNTGEPSEEPKLTAKIYKQASIPSESKLKDAFFNPIGALILLFIGNTYFVNELILRNLDNEYTRNIEEGLIERKLEDLARKGYLAAYDVNNITYYCATPMFAECFNKKQRRQILQDCLNILMKCYNKKPLKKGRINDPVIVGKQSSPYSLVVKYTQTAYELSLTFANVQKNVGLSFRWQGDIDGHTFTISPENQDEISDVHFMLSTEYSDAVMSGKTEIIGAGSSLPTDDTMKNATVPNYFYITDKLYRWDGNMWVDILLNGDNSPDDSEQMDNSIQEINPDTAPAITENITPDDKGTDEPHNDDITRPIDAEAPNPDVITIHPIPVNPKVLADDIDIITMPEEYGFTDNMTASAIAQAIIEKNISPKFYNIYKLLIEKLIQENRSISDGEAKENSLAQALLLLATLKKFRPEYEILLECYSSALDIGIAEHHYSGKSMVQIANDAQNNPELYLASMMRAIIAPDNLYDHELVIQAKGIMKAFDAYYPDLGKYQSLFKHILDALDSTRNKSGFSQAVMRRFVSEAQQKEELADLSYRAGLLIQPPQSSTRNMKALPVMNGRCFGEGSNLCTCMQIIQASATEDIDLIEAVLSDFTYDDGITISNDKVETFIDTSWKEALGAQKDYFDLKYEARARSIRHVINRLNVMKDWLEVVGSDKVDNDDVIALTRYRRSILEEIDSLMSNNVESYTDALMWNALKSIQNRLLGITDDKGVIFYDLLRTGYFALEEDTHYPIIEYSFVDVPGFEPWANALRHIATPAIGFEDVLELITDGTDNAYRDNIGQALAICRLLEKNDEESRFSADLDNARKQAKSRVERFCSELELSFAYGRIDENTKEDLLANVSYLVPYFDETFNYGVMDMFLSCMMDIVKKHSDERGKELRQDIEERRAEAQSEDSIALLDRALEKISQPECNYVVAEEYLNRFVANSPDWKMETVPETENYFLKFISPEVFDVLENVCRRNSDKKLRVFGLEHVKREHARLKTASQYVKSAESLITVLPDRPDRAEETNPGRIVLLLQELGILARSATRITSAPNMLRYSVQVDPDETGRAEYMHPVGQMGTGLKSPLEVVFIFGRKQANDIVDQVCQLELHEHALVFMNGALDLASRRQLAERFHREKSGQNPFLLIDWILLMHLAMYPRSERLSIMLSCTMPYTSMFNMFVTAGSVADEMFIGRRSELNRIIDPNGPVIVYGGRQLGKTALLEKAVNMQMKPEKKSYAILARELGVSDEKIFTEDIVAELRRVGLSVRDCSSIKYLCRELRDLHDQGVWNKLYIFIDESDAILSTFRSQTPQYASLHALTDLMNDTKHDFKFVLAGLHNVCRVANDPNTVFGHLAEPLLIKPLASYDALELLSRPLRYLGFRIDPAQLEVMLVNTCFYPGIIHFVGYSIAENLSTQYASYYQANKGNPPYELSEKQLGDIINSNELNKEIDKRIIWTLEVDPRYYMLARCIAVLYLEYPENNKSGHDIDAILECAELLDIPDFRQMPRTEVESLLIELVSMGILAQTGVDTFRLRQRRFLNTIGTTREQIESDIKNDLAERVRKAKA